MFYYRSYLLLHLKQVIRAWHLLLQVSIWFRLIKQARVDMIMISITNIMYDMS